jgi:cell division topological specificity factor
MSLLDLFFKRKASAGVARERLQVLLAHERIATGHSELLAKLQEEIIQVIAKHIKIDREQVHVKLDRGKDMSTLEIDVDLPAATLVGAR